MYQFDDAVSEVLLWLKRLSANVMISKPMVRAHMNEALKEVYQMAVIADPDFYMTRASFTTGTLIAYPTSYRSIVLIECTDTNCTSGYARPVARRDLTNILNSTSAGPTNEDPISNLQGAGILVNPARQGYVYYLKGCPTITDYTTDLETLIPWLWIEPLILKTMELARLRSTSQIEQPTGIEKGLRLVDIATQSLKDSYKPLRLFNQTVPEPSTPNPMQ